DANGPRRGARDEEPEASALDRRRFLAEPLEGLEQALELRRLEAGAGVLDAEPHTPRRAVRVDGPADDAGRAVVLDRIRGDVHQHLAQAPFVGTHGDA